MTEADWVNWWCCTWRWMHPGWQPRLASFTNLLRSRHGDVQVALDITPSPPPTPHAGAIQWLSLTEQQQSQALALVAAICFAKPSAQPQVSDEQWSWCRGLAKALRPGLWLQEEELDARCMLGAWLGEGCWSRLRLTWAPDDELAPAPDLPARKLDALWHAVLWKVLT
ncbi:MAG: hypothetical protein GAK32_02375 [Pseudomonas fluorescens]|nr:MAG: hypothetical protein GAK32_02375 [Pseudomonas fluorescens]